MKRPDARLVYSSDPDQARRLRQVTESSVARGQPPEQQTIRVGLDRKRRKGKTVTVAVGFVLAEQELAKLASELKRRCGAGGTAKDGEIEVQGEHVDGIVSELEKRGFRVKKR